jgi:uncharacterized protein
MDELSAAFLNRRLHLTIMPTEKCNYRCVYCYEDFENGRMAPEVTEGLARLIAKRAPNLDFLKISWFGGEPLLAMPVIEKIMQVAKECCEKYPISLQAGATTNGHLLSPKTFHKLCELGVNHYQITLDGPSYIHNERRRTAGGAGDILTILNNLRAMCQTDSQFGVTLRIHIDEVSFLAFDALLSELGAISYDSRVLLHFERLRNMGRDLPDTIQAMSWIRFEEAVKTLAARLRELGILSPDRSALAEEYVCYAAMPNSYVIRSTGEIQMCTVALSSSHNSVGILKEDGSITLNDNYMQWLNGWKTGDRNALHCPAKAITAES